MFFSSWQRIWVHTSLMPLYTRSEKHIFASLCKLDELDHISILRQQLADWVAGTLFKKDLQGKFDKGLYAWKSRFLTCSADSRKNGAGNKRSNLDEAVIQPIKKMRGMSSYISSLKIIVLDIKSMLDSWFIVQFSLSVACRLAVVLCIYISLYSFSYSIIYRWLC